MTSRLFDQDFTHAGDVACALGLVRADACRSVQDACRDIPTGPQPDAVAARQVGDPVVAAGRELREPGCDLVPGRLRVQAEEGDPELTEVVVHLRREEVRLRLPLLPERRCVVIPVVNVEGQGELVVEEFGVHRPTPVRRPKPVADELRAMVLHEHVERGEPAVGSHDQADAFKLARERPVVGSHGGRQPTLVDATPPLLEREVVVRVELDPASRGAEGAWDPRRGKADDSAARVQRSADGRGADSHRCFSVGGHVGFLSRRGEAPGPPANSRAAAGRNRPHPLTGPISGRATDTDFPRPPC